MALFGIDFTGLEILCVLLVGQGDFDRDPRHPGAAQQESRGYMSGIFQPIGSVKLTNVSVIRLKRGGKRYEVAAYKNKIGEFRKNL